jgi:hypothetical protein
VALVIKYQFLEFAQQNHQKKRKTEERKTNVIDYTYLKLPCVMFLSYLSMYSSTFIEDCERLKIN